MVRALKEEYGLRRGCFLRISPRVTRARKDQMKQILEAEGFKEDNLTARIYIDAGIFVPLGRTPQ